MPILDHLIAKGLSTFTSATLVGGDGSVTLQAATGGQSGATLIPGGVAIVTVVSTSGYAVKLPACSPCSDIWVWNGGAQVLGVYGQTGEAIGSGAANAVFYVASKKSGIFKKVSPTQWAQNLSA